MSAGPWPSVLDGILTASACAHVFTTNQHPAAVTGAVVELPIRDFSYHVTSAFNDLSLHIFPAAKLQQAGLPP
jgi:hypothetical protein